MLPVITIDEAKCRNPLACGKCVLICPTNVLNLNCEVPPQKFREADPSDYRVRGIHLLACSVCMECVNICPEEAIQVSFDGGRAGDAA